MYEYLVSNQEKMQYSTLIRILFLKNSGDGKESNWASTGTLYNTSRRYLNQGTTSCLLYSQLNFPFTHSFDISLTLVFPTHLSKQQASESVWASSMKEPRPWGLKGSLQGGREGMKTVIDWLTARRMIRLQEEFRQHPADETAWGPGAKL